MTDAPREPQRRPVKRTWSGLYVPDWYEESPEADVSSLSQEDFETQLDGLETFRTNPDVRCVWEFDPSRGPLPGLSFPPGATCIAGSDAWIVCPYVPGKIIIHSPIALSAGRFSFGITHGVLFDSNLYDLIVRFVELPEQLSAQSTKGIRNLIEALVTRRYDYQLMPYVLEALAKNPCERGYEYAFRGTRAILKLHTMDKEYFRATGTVRSDPDRLRDYESDFGTTDLDLIAQAQLEPYQGFSKTPLEVSLTLLAMIEMVLIQRVSKPSSGFDAKFAAFDEFLFGELGLIKGSFRNMGILCFSGKLDRWIRVQANSNTEKALALLSNCAWDLYLGNIYQQILAESPETQPTLCHFCTRERELAYLLSVSQLRALKVLKKGGPIPFFEVDFSFYRDAIGDGWERSLLLADRRMEGFLEQRQTGSLQTVDKDRIPAMLGRSIQKFREAIGRKDS